MQEFFATVSWQRAGQEFANQRYSRGHEWQFDGGLRVPASSSPLSVPLPMSVAANVDPEEALVAAASSCHMLFFLSLAAQRGYTIDDYRDDAVGEMGRQADGRTGFTRIVLRPRIAFAGTPPTADALAALHHDAHTRCYIANSLKADIIVEEAS
ncbi:MULTISPECIES: OsmC family protein [unclassified Janthinobacterium]|uniref:OsmC family protein n=1 Tax=unclassified Janthinobacterium TaxID=2610881 RepID=UPI00160C996C|nr:MULTISPECIES: OsmC family protein [unclassified Janthinobacterium]MBB5605959.1 organic hydroperoxide reductase OsmC/OhrA [Janthinobacterium sp. S3T4]MBB5611123.1 organic hydroperoxide reductase OsmC/OhrA [Janthinobacterium sp. S3M3]